MDIKSGLYIQRCTQRKVTKGEKKQKREKPQSHSMASASYPLVLCAHGGSLACAGKGSWFENVGTGLSELGTILASFTLC
jgi:hypothetical protein